MMDAGNLMSMSGQSAAAWAAGGRGFKLQRSKNSLAPPGSPPPGEAKPNKGKEAEKTEQKAQTKKPDLDPKEKKAEEPQKVAKTEGPSKSAETGAPSKDSAQKFTEICFAAPTEICVARQPALDIVPSASDNVPTNGFKVAASFIKPEELALKLKASMAAAMTETLPKKISADGVEVVGRPVWIGNVKLPTDVDAPIKAVAVDSVPQPAQAADKAPRILQPASEVIALASDTAPTIALAADVAEPVKSDVAPNSDVKLKIENALKAATQDVNAEKGEEIETAKTKLEFHNPRLDLWHPAAELANSKAAEHAQKVAPTQFDDLFAKAKVLEQVADRIEALAAARPKQGITIHLEPRELGTITLVVKASGADVDARLSASDQNVRKALADSMTMLRAALEAKGMTIGTLTVANEHSASFGFGHHANQSAHRHGVPANTHAYSTDSNDSAMPWAFQSAGSGIDLWI